MILRAQEELSQNYETAKADRAAAQRKANYKARAAAEQALVAAKQAQSLRKDMAAQAETDLYEHEEPGSARSSRTSGTGWSRGSFGLCFAKSVSPYAPAHHSI